MVYREYDTVNWITKNELKLKCLNNNNNSTTTEFTSE